MPCEERYLELLSGHMDGCNTEAEEAELLQHLEGCAHCRDLLHAMQETQQLLKDDMRPAPADLTQRIMTAVSKAPKKQRRSKGFWISTAAAGVAAAAMLCFAFLGGGGLAMPSTEADHFAGEPIAEYFYEEIPSDAEFVEPANAADDMEIQSFYPTGEFYSASVAPPEVSAPPTPPEQDPPKDIAQEAPPPTLPAIEHGNQSDGGRPVRNRYASAAHSIPTLVLWGVSAEEFSLLAQLQPEELSPLSEQNMEGLAPDGLYRRYLSALTLLRPDFSQENSAASQAAAHVTVYLLDYAAFSQLFSEAAGQCEISVYFPAELRDLNECQVLLVAEGESAPASTEISSPEADPEE